MNKEISPAPNFQNQMKVNIYFELLIRLSLIICRWLPDIIEYHSEMTAQFSSLCTNNNEATQLQMTMDD